MNLYRRNVNPEAFTLKQLKSVVDVLFDFGQRFNTRDIVEFTYRIQGRRRHLEGYLVLNPYVSSQKSSMTDRYLDLRNFNMSVPNITMSAFSNVNDPYEAKAWDTWRSHPSATVIFSHYGGYLPFHLLAAAVFGIYDWAWDLILGTKTENFNVHLVAPLLDADGVSIDVKGWKGWLPLWALRSLVASIFEFWLKEEREVSVLWENVEGRNLWAYVTKGGARPLGPKTI